ncbi:Gfo/Idh/MocA family protein [Cohnella silvisoli]|uniref:Gfo/Idh/MocA family oxidoreductase n=1 Tax=Cohnella silvisoli TaxID=2873699 RepID=A0ABV1KRF0_9BACL|nr:Gfo/Idh/MocA family oxidoreductase [Cohnella silvisoli]MCD9021673.1 Gfo/Idh/MocA family oxidoreductase [Cohnella silvisoli]
MSKINIGVIGTGSISSLHLSSYQNNPDAQIYAICDVNLGRAEKTVEQYNAKKAYSDYRELLQDPDIDGVSICTWNNTHAEIAIAALNAGKHVLVEKPLCRTVEEALRIEESVRLNGKIFQVGFVRRFDPNAQLAKQFLDNGELGEVYYAKASCLRRLGNPGGWFADKSRSGGGPLIDLGVHIIDLCWYLMGKPKVKSVNGAIHSKLGNRSHVKGLNFYKAADYDAQKNNVEDLAVAFIRFHNGATLAVETSFTLHAKKDEISVRLYGDLGGVEIEPEFMIVSEKYDTIMNLNPQVNHLSIDVNGSFQNEIDHFISSIQTGHTPIASVQDGVEIMKILCAVYQSGEEEREIVFD